MSKLDCNQCLSAGRTAARKAAPYFAPLILLLVMRETPGLASGNCLGMAVSVHGFLLYDPEAVVQWTPKQLAGLLIHEVLHLWLRHFRRATNLEAQAWNEACDRVVNPIVLGLQLELPVGYLMPADIGMATGLTALEYYRGAQERQQTQNESVGQSPRQPAGQQEPKEGSPQDGQGDQIGSQKGKGKWGKCGSAAGNPVPQEPSADDAQARSSATVERATKQAAEALQEYASRQAGTVPGQLLRHVTTVLAPPKIDWRRKLDVAVRNAVQWRPGASVARYDGLNRRQACVGYGLGRPILARLREPVCRVALCIDTSASMCAGELSSAVREAKGVLSAINAEVMFIAFDAEVQSLQPVRRIEEVAKLLKGGGGTSFVPVFESLEKSHPKPEVVIVMTDGMGRLPDHHPNNMHVVWVLIGNCTARPRWGDIVEVD